MPCRLNIFTVGTSLLDNLEKEPAGLALAGELREIIIRNDARSADLTEILAGESGSTDRPGLLWCIDRLARRNPQDKNAFAPAEVAALVSIPETTQDDTLVLLASDTAEGYFCALVNAFLMTGLSGSVEVWQEVWDNHPRQLNLTEQLDVSIVNFALKRKANGKCKILKIPGLNPADRKAFENEQAAGNLVSILAELIFGARAEGLEPRIHFTGGFKASIPILAQAAAWLDGVDMFALYENAKDLIHVPILPAIAETKLRRAVMAFGVGSDKAERLKRIYGLNADQMQRMLNADCGHYSSLNQVADKDLDPLFQPGTNGRLQLSVLGQALHAVTKARLRHGITRDQEEREVFG